MFGSLRNHFNFSYKCAIFYNLACTYHFFNDHTIETHCDLLFCISYMTGYVIIFYFKNHSFGDENQLCPFVNVCKGMLSVSDDSDCELAPSPAKKKLRHQKCMECNKFCSQQLNHNLVRLPLPEASFVTTFVT